ncbi:alpha/beta hydrolase [Sphingobacteriales bacterium UPWRP_1]|nr:alpha/beta hydrolase [Sphingobacteriales bacterium TSM_CSM]PSJ77414.1 alpha/beta hydrolase [Sphingobacteriales bacterium UPWRP_1]
MPVIPSSYKAPKWLFNRHFETIYPYLFRKVGGVHYDRERIDTPDGDFLDLDWSLVGADVLLIVCHGLEGDTGRPYVRGMVKAANLAGYDALAWNYRGCSGEPNRLLRGYHSGATDDLDWVIQHALATNRYRHVGLIGYSLGANLILKYAGESGHVAKDKVKALVAFSAPVNLASSCHAIMQGFNRIYEKSFLNSLLPKMKQKAAMLPGAINTDLLQKVKRLVQFDDFFTAPIHGFKDARDYYTQCSAKQFLPAIAIPTLIVNALNDTFLGKECYPVAIAEKHPLLYLEMPDTGGHVAFSAFETDGLAWSEKRAVAFLSEKLAR